MIHINPALIAGAGPAGLTSALELSRAGVPVAVHEAEYSVGGTARTETYRGYRFDIGGHRFSTKVAEVERLWHELLGHELVRVPRLSRIFYQGQYFAYPLQFPNVVRNLGLVESARMWGRADADLITMATSEIDQLGLAPAGAVVDGCVIRQRKAYPVYDDTYRLQVERIRRGLAAFTNLQTIGRNGMHRYNNQDHSMLTGMLAARNVLGEQHDLWDVNTERSYYEDQQLTQERAG